MVSNLFFLINFSIAILASIVGIIFSFSTFLIVVINREVQTVNNILLCNSCAGIIFYSIITITTSIYGFDEDWSLNAPLCSLRGYCFNVSIAIICHSKSIQAISRLFFAILYKHKYLLTRRTHQILILLSWIISFSLYIPMFFIDNGFIFEKESRICLISSKMPILAFYAVLTSCISSFSIIFIIYTLIVCYVYRSTRRVQAAIFISNQNTITTHNHIHRAKRELKLMTQMIRQMSILGAGGTLYLFLIIWQATREQQPPQPLYLLAMNLITMAISTVPIIQIIVTKELKQLTIRYLSYIINGRHIHQEQHT